MLIEAYGLASSEVYRPQPSTCANVCYLNQAVDGARTKFRNNSSHSRLLHNDAFAAGNIKGS